MKPVPPLLMLAEGRRPRPRRCALANPRELILHRSVVDVLRKFAKPDWQWAHYPSGEKRDIRTAAKLKAMGVKRGWADLLLISPRGILHSLELKRRGESLTEDQESFQNWAVSKGVPYSVAWSLDEALSILGHWGCLTHNVEASS